ncbi:MAG: hypothetical protein Q9167_006672 [Letrouitia subvulpina]
MTTSESTEARELNLVGKVELRIALAESDSKLEAILKTYLPPLLLKLASNYITVRNKIYRTPSGSIAKAISSNLLPEVVNGLYENFDLSTRNTASLFNFFLKLLHSTELPPRGSHEDLVFREKLGFQNRIQDAAFVSSWLGKLILYNTSPSTERCPGLGVEDCRFLQSYDNANTWIENAHGGMSLFETKIIAAKFLASGAFTDHERLLPALCASSDQNPRLSEIGDDILKHAIQTISLEDASLIEDLLQVYLGTRGTTGSLPARPSLQTKILAILCRSQRASSYATKAVQIVQEGLAPLNDQQANVRSGPTKQGLESSRLRAQIFAYVNWLARVSKPEDIEFIAPLLVNQLRNYIESQGWPHFDTDTSKFNDTETQSRSLGYESIGILAKASPTKLLLDTDLFLLRWLFNSLSSDSTGKDVSISIEQAITSVVGAFSDKLDEELEQNLTNLLLHHMNLNIGEIDGSNLQVVRSTRFAAVRFANRCLPYRNPVARWIDLLAIGGNAERRDEVVEEGKRGLDPYWHKMLNPNKVNSHYPGASSNTKYEFPDFKSLALQLFGPHSIWAPSRSHNRPLHLPDAYASAIVFSRSVLLYQALSTTESAPPLDDEWQRKLEVLVSNNETARSTIQEYLQQLIGSDNESKESLRDYLRASCQGMAFLGGDRASQCGHCLFEICSLGDDAMTGDLAPEIAIFQGAIFSSQKPLREVSSRCFGILASHENCPQDSIITMTHLFDRKLATWHESVGSAVLEVHGAILAEAYRLSRLSFRHRSTTSSVAAMSSLTTLVIEIFQQGRDKMLTEAGIIALSEMILSGSLSLEAEPLSQHANVIIQKLKEYAKSGNEKAIKALGVAAMYCSETDQETSCLEQLLGILYDLHEIKDAAVQFAVGEALGCAASGWNSGSLIGALDVRGKPPVTPNRKSTLRMTLERILKDAKKTKPALRQASVIWLLCLVQFCGHLPDVQSKLRNCQSFFKEFLADRDSLNQETASRGLSLVFEKGDKTIKGDLVRDLVNSFTGATGSGLAGTVSEETELFEPGSLPTGEGSSITTYKDIMSLASEVGNPSLVYRFMSLAANNAIWSSRAAFGRFGLSNVLSDSSVDGYLAQNPKLYPALYRYRFDPNTNVRNSMNVIWNTLVQEPAVTIDTQFDNIMRDLLKNIIGKEWRTRQACCAAIAELVQDKPIEKYEKYLGEIWTVTFKVCDDIKESVRIAAMTLTRVLTKTLVNRLESSANGAEKMLRNVLPFLLSPSGLENSAQDVQAFSLSALLDIIKKSTKVILRPFIPDLVARLVLLLSTLEPQGIEYIRLRAEQYGMTGQQIDDARLSSVRQSPMLEAIERCLDFLDEHTMSNLQIPLQSAITSGLGLPSRVGGSRVLVSLATRHHYIFKPYADRFLRLARKQVLDRNDSISASYATACGYLAKLASDDEILKFIEHCHQLYFQPDEERHRVISGDMICSFSKYSKDRFTSFSSEILPLVFFAKHDLMDQAKEPFQNTWDENVGGSRTVLLYMKEIVALGMDHLDSPSWLLKHTAALTIADTVELSGNEISDVNATILWPAIEKAVDGKTWEGKEKVLQAFIKFVKGDNAVTKEPGIQNQMQTRIEAECLSIEKGTQDNLQSEDETLAAASGTLLRAINPGSQASKGLSRNSGILNLASTMTTKLTFKKSLDLTLNLSQALDLTIQVLAKSGSRIVHNAIYEAEKSLFEKIEAAGITALSEPVERILVGFIQTLFPRDTHAEQTRLKAAETATSIATLSGKSRHLRTALISEINKARAHERSASVKVLLDSVEKLMAT